MTENKLRDLVSQVLLKLEGNEAIGNIIGEAAVDVFIENGIDDESEEGFFAMMDVITSISLTSCV